VAFSTGKTGAAARQIRDGFAGFVESANGKLGHPGDGCLEKLFLD
jgi:hypothetical protein